MSQCRACKAPITWFNTEKGNKIPIDRDPVPDGNVLPIDSDTVRVVGPLDVYTLRQSDPDVLLFNAHFTTCPNAQDFRRSG